MVRNYIEWALQSGVGVLWAWAALLFIGTVVVSKVVR